MLEHIAVGALDTPIGLLRIACSERGVCRLVFPAKGAQAVLDRWIESHMPEHKRSATSGNWRARSPPRRRRVRWGRRAVPIPCR
jgi:hypothetical protein